MQNHHIAHVRTTRHLFLLGSGVFPTVGTANPTLTLAALALWAADTIQKELILTAVPLPLPAHTSCARGR